jgi:hypothetical protein
MVIVISTDVISTHPCDSFIAVVGMYGLTCQLNSQCITMVTAQVTSWVAMPMGTANLYHLVDTFEFIPI